MSMSGSIVDIYLYHHCWHYIKEKKMSNKIHRKKREKNDTNVQLFPLTPDVLPVVTKPVVTMGPVVACPVVDLPLVDVLVMSIVVPDVPVVDTLFKVQH